MEGSSDSAVIVVGGGPAGALLAYLLASRGVETTLIERQTDFSREFRGEGLMPSGLAMLDAAGFHLEKVPVVRSRQFRGFRAAKPFFAFDVDAGPNPEPFPLVVSQPHLLESIVEAGEAEPCFRFLRGAAVRDLLVEDGRVAGVRVQTVAGEERLRARLVVGADGRASVVRRKQNLPSRDLGTPMDIVWVKLPWPEAIPRGQVRAYVGGGHLLIALPAATGGDLQLAWVILKGTYGGLRARGIEEWVHAMADHVDEELGAHLMARASEFSRPFLLDAVTDRVEGWARPGSLVIGDAAHTMSPVGGQGLNVAMRDAVVAANHLVPAFREGGDVDAAAALVEPERGPEIDTIQRAASFPPRVILGTRFYHSWARAFLAHAVNSSFGASRAGTVVDLFFFGSTEVKLRV